MGIAAGFNSARIAAALRRHENAHAELDVVFGRFKRDIDYVLTRS
jgi:hypothetical protein